MSAVLHSFRPELRVESTVTARSTYTVNVLHVSAYLCMSWRSRLRALLGGFSRPVGDARVVLESDCWFVQGKKRLGGNPLGMDTCRFGGASIQSHWGAAVLCQR